jgi:PAS domain S-box-containing protein
VAGICILQALRNSDGTIVDFRVTNGNAAAEKMLGESLTRMSEETLFEVLPGMKSLLASELISVVETGESFHTEKHYLSDGKNNWFDISGVKNADGLIITFHDITRQKTAEKETFKNLQLLRQSEDVAKMGSWEYIIKEKKFNWSEGMYRIFGVPDNTVVTPDTYVAYATPEDEAIAKRISNHLKTDHRPFEYTFHIKTGDVVKTIKVKARTLSNEKGEVEKLLGIDVDITALAESENKIKEQRHFISQIVETIPDMLSVMEYPSRKILYVNNDPFINQGYDSIQILNSSPDTFKKFVHPEDVELVDYYFDRFSSLDDDIVNSVEYRAHNNLGTWQWFRCRGKVFKRNEAGFATQILNVIQNINMQKLAEEKIREQGYYIQRLVDTVPDTILIYNIQLDELVYSNAEVTHLLGYTPEELHAMGETMYPKIIHPEDLEEQELTLTMLRNARDNEIIEKVFRMIHKDGSVRYVQARRTPFKRGRNGRVSEIVAVFHDITRLKEAEQENIRIKDLLALRAENKYRQLFNSIDEGFCIIEVSLNEGRVPNDYKFLECNPAFEKLTGLKGVVGKTILEFDPQHEAHWFELYGNVALYGQPKRLLQRAKGLNNRWFEVYAFSAGDPGKNQVAVLLNDVTERKNFEQRLLDLNARLQESDRVRTEFFSNVSHEFRTPLTLLLGPLQDVINEARASGKDEELDKLKLAYKNAVRLQKLVNNLLDFSRIEAGKMDAQFQPTDLAKLTRDLSSNFRPAVERAGLEYEVDVKANEEPVYVDRSMWEKVVFNLLSNALKYTLEGRIKVSLRHVGQDVELNVTDSGSGIAKENIPSLFERFRRIEGTLARTYEGSGIGLALVQEMVKLHAGCIRVESEPGKGSTFTVTIPRGKEHLPKDKIIEKADAFSGNFITGQDDGPVEWLPIDNLIAGAGTATKTVAKSVATITGKMPLIFLVDDNPDMREYLHSLLIEQYNIISLDNGTKVIDLLKKGVMPDLILSDIMMPGMDGFALLVAVNQISGTGFR